MEEFIKPIVGWIFLWVKFRNKKKVHSALKEHYDNSYSNAGAIVSVKFVGIILILLLLLLLSSVIISLFVHN